MALLSPREKPDALNAKNTHTEPVKLVDLTTTKKEIAMNDANLIDITKNAEKQMIYMARVSNPNNQENPKIERLLHSCLKRGHWSVFEMAHATFEINTSRAISAQILRHRSFTFQEFSQRYADTTQLGSIPVPEIRSPHPTDRQMSVPFKSMGVLAQDVYVGEEIQSLMRKHFDESEKFYKELLDLGVAKETARFVLPLASPTRLYMTGNIRSWIHYINARCYEGTQKEHRLIAESIKSQLAEKMPVLAKAALWKYDGTL